MGFLMRFTEGIIFSSWGEICQNIINFSLCVHLLCMLVVQRTLTIRNCLDERKRKQTDKFY